MVSWGPARNASVINSFISCGKILAFLPTCSVHVTFFFAERPAFRVLISWREVTLNSTLPNSCHFETSVVSRVVCSSESGERIVRVSSWALRASDRTCFGTRATRKSSSYEHVIKIRLKQGVLSSGLLTDVARKIPGNNMAVFPSNLNRRCVFRLHAQCG